MAAAQEAAPIRDAPREMNLDMGQLQLLHTQQLSWLPDETVYSFASRFHRLTGLSSPAQTCKLLFGAERPSTVHDLTSGLQHLCDATDGILGDARTIAVARTVLAYCLPFQTKGVQEHALRALCANSIGSLKFRLGIQTTKFGSDFPLKACTTCIGEDERIHHVAYWHRLHQMPGIWMCLAHGTPLQRCTQRSNLRLRFGLLLPDRNHLAPCTYSGERVPVEISRLAAMTAGVVSLPLGFSFDLMRIARTLRAAVGTSGAAAFHYAPEAIARYAHWCSTLRAIPELENLPRDEAQARRDLEYLSRKQRVRPHPVRWMVALACFYTDFAEFRDAYSGQADLICALRSDEQVRQRPLKTVSLRPGVSMRALARMAGVDVATAMAHAAAAGIQALRRPKKLRGDLRVEMIGLLEAGGDKAVVAHRAGVSVSTVTRLLFTHVGLHETWEEARREIRRKKARAEWMASLDGFGVLGTTACRAQSPAAYAWLRRNDKAWLAETIDTIEKQNHRSSRNCIRWDERDTDFARQIRAASAGAKQSLKLADLIALVPTLRPKLSKLERLPLTAAALSNACGDRRRDATQHDLFDS